MYGMANTKIRDNHATDAKNIAIRELELMHHAIQDNQLKKALFHKKLADTAIDEMILNNKMVEQKDRK